MDHSFPVRRTPRLLLREIVDADAPALFAIHSDIETMRWFGVDPMKEPREAIALATLFASWFGSKTGVRWALVRRIDNQLIGTAGLFRWNKSWRNCMIGFELARSFHHQGYMIEAVSSILHYGFSDLRLNRVQAEIHPENIASGTLVEKLGFKLEGVHREQGFWGDQFHDLNCHGLLARDWHESDVESERAPNDHRRRGDDADDRT